MKPSKEDVLKELELLPIWRYSEAHRVDESPKPEVFLQENTISRDSAHQPSTGSIQERLALIAQMDWNMLEAGVKHCQSCGLSRSRTQAVLGMGDQNADWLFVGEAPGAEEDKHGQPFIGQAGRLLDNMLAAISLKRGENVYIANVLKCRPPDNRDPHANEVTQCEPYLKRQVALVNPKVIVALGKFAAQTLLSTDLPLSQLRGRLHDYQEIPVVVTYHPAYLLRNLSDKAKAWDDLCLAKKMMQGLVHST